MKKRGGRSESLKFWIIVKSAVGFKKRRSKKKTVIPETTKKKQV